MYLQNRMQIISIIEIMATTNKIMVRMKYVFPDTSLGSAELDEEVVVLTLSGTRTGKYSDLKFMKFYDIYLIIILYKTFQTKFEKLMKKFN